MAERTLTTAVFTKKRVIPLEVARDQSQQSLKACLIWKQAAGYVIFDGDSVRENVA